MNLLYAIGGALAAPLVTGVLAGSVAKATNSSLRNTLLATSALTGVGAYYLSGRTRSDTWKSAAQGATIASAADALMLATSMITAPTENDRVAGMLHGRRDVPAAIPARAVMYRSL